MLAGRDALQHFDADAALEQVVEDGIAPCPPFRNLLQVAGAFLRCALVIRVETVGDHGDGA
ncbi:hypothetical protein GCM10010517_44940 [Streptosporangium fragile]|uniref:Uncharacterized protein n=1 Tax=Streptosporangium fragile TaxID=46186 RepID=A0ABN3W1F6_9ACTN